MYTLYTLLIISFRISKINLNISKLTTLSLLIVMGSNTLQKDHVRSSQIVQYTE